MGKGANLEAFIHALYKIALVQRFVRPPLLPTWTDSVQKGRVMKKEGVVLWGGSNEQNQGCLVLCFESSGRSRDLRIR